MVLVKGIQSRNGFLYWRKVIPVQLRPLLGGKFEFVVALGTKDLPTAIQRARVEQERIAKILNHAKALANGDTTAGPLETFKENYKRQLLDVDTRFRLHNSQTDEHLESERHALDDLLADLTARLRRGGLGTKIEQAKLLAHIDAVQVAIGRNRGDSTGASDEALKMTEVWAKYVKDRRPTSRTEDDYGAAWTKFTTHAGNVAVQSVTKQTVRSWRDVMVSEPIRDRRGTPITRNGRTIVSASTVRKNLNAVKAVFSWCLEHDLLATNPCHGVNVQAPSDGEEDAPRVPYTEQDLETIFTSPSSRPEPRMLSTLLLVTGMRLSEAVGLRVEDVKQDRKAGHTGEGVVYVDLRAYAGRRLKSKAATRRIPIHKGIAPAFLAHVNEQKKKAGDGRTAGATMVFPDVEAPSRSVDAHAFSMAWSRFVNTLNLPDRARKQLHSLRHSWQTAAREAAIPDDVRKVLLGHAGGGVAGGYGSWPIATLAEHVNRMVWPEVVITGRSKD